MSTSHQPVIVSAARTPIGKFLGGLAPIGAVELGAIAISAALERAGLDTRQLDEVFMGNVVSAGLGQAPARQAALRAGVPESVSATTVNKVCASGLTAVIMAANSIMAGDGTAYVAGGMESMSNAPHLLQKSRTGYRLGDQSLIDSVIHDGLWCAIEDQHMGAAAEWTADCFRIGRKEMDAFAVQSHRKAVAATKTGRFDAEIVPVEIAQKGGSRIVKADELPREDTTEEILAKLSPAFRAEGRVTAGNAPALSDGAAALVVMDEAVARNEGLTPLARITGSATAAIAPRDLFSCPPLAIRKLLNRVGMRLEDFDLLEVNEAFSAQILANGGELDWDWEKVNVNGGAVALGHPIGASGARILTTLLYSLRARGLRTGLVAACHGGGGAVAMSIELV